MTSTCVECGRGDRRIRLGLCDACYTRKARSNPEIAERDRAVSRAWKVRHHERRVAYDREYVTRPEVCGTCTGCGNLMGRANRGGRGGLCKSCRSAQRAARSELIVQLWAEGAMLDQIAAALDTTRGAIGVEMHRLRAEGYDLPFRRARKVTA